jgi:electron transfer flavoprotein alpha/beta subunit
LVKKGWSKNEIIYEIQRIYGNDVLILKKSLDDERGMVGKLGLPVAAMFGIATFFLARKLRFDARKAQALAR